MATAQTLNEDKAVRTKRIEEREYAKVLVYGRVFTGVPKGTAEDYEQDVLAPGSSMISAWASPDDAVSSDIDGPRVVSVERRQGEDVASDVLSVTFVGVVLLSTLVTDEYNETRRNVPTRRNAYSTTTVTWGIIAALTDASIPAPGDLLGGDGVDGSGNLAYCTGPVFNHTALPGRVLVRTEWVSQDLILRSTRVEEREYGRVKVFERILPNIPKPTPEDYEDGPFAPGSPLTATYADPGQQPSRHIDGPRVVSAVRTQEPGTDRDRLTVTYLGFVLPKAFVHNAYNETKRSAPVARDAFTTVTTTWGITASADYDTVPSPGDYLDGQSGSARSAICTAPVRFDDTRLPGRILVRADWISRHAAFAILEAS